MLKCVKMLIDNERLILVLCIFFYIFEIIIVIDRLTMYGWRVEGGGLISQRKKKNM